MLTIMVFILCFLVFYLISFKLEFFEPPGRLVLPGQEEKPGVILRTVLEVFLENGSPVNVRSAPSGYGSASGVAALNNPGHASGGVVSFDSLKVRMSGKEAATLRQGRGVRFNRNNIFEHGARASDQEMPDRYGHFSDDPK